jgi:lysophospholipase L1-like esterase
MGGTLRLLVLGDSIAWGQGLLDENKFCSLVAKGLEKPGDLEVELTTLAHSGAKIGLIPLLDSPATAKFGEIPEDQPTISQQVNQLAPQCADVILLTGGINDITIATILNPLTPKDRLAQLIEEQCHQAMVRLLLDLTDPDKGCPDAKIMVLGYYPILSTQSRLQAVAAFCDAIGLALAGVPGALVAGVATELVLGDIEAQCLFFASESAKQLQAAVNEVIDLRSGRGSLKFVDPGFGIEHSALTEQPWIWGLTPELGPEDQLAAARAPVCDETFEPGWNREFCHIASIGHPNVAGALVYANAILAALAGTQQLTTK